MLDGAGELLDGGDEGAQRGDEAQGDPALGLDLELAGVALGSATEPLEQSLGGATPTVVVGDEETSEALGSQVPSALRRGVG